ncbi:probable cytochrome P450 49a1 [Tetranychus urticae]|nr:probable cytochrome P450 49a1 [Tetranychus urticae]
MASKSVSYLGRQLTSYQVQNGSFNTAVRKLTNIAATDLKPFSDVPSLSKIPYVGSMHHYVPALGGYDIAKVHEFAEKNYYKLGPIYKEDLRALNAPGDFAFWLSDADDIEKVYRSGGKFPIRGGFDSLAVYRKTRPDVYKALGLLILNGKDWHTFRSKIQPVLLQPRVISNYSNSISSIADEMINVIRQSRDEKTLEIADLGPELYRYTLESIAFIALDKRLNCLSDYGTTQRNIVASVKELFHLEATLNESFLWRIIGRPYGKNWKRFMQINDEFTSMVFEFVQEKIKQLASEPVKNPEDDVSVLELFLSRPDCTPEDAVTMTMDMFYAGIDTTAHLILFTLHHLANHSDFQERVYQEIMDLSNGTGHLDSEQLSNLTFLKACIKETSRLTPVVPILMRISQEPIALSGYAIPARSFLILNHYTVHHRPDYFTDPLSFKPDRWARKSREEIKAHLFAVLPFGHGPRMCIGRRIAELETLSLLSKIIYNFKVTAKHTELPLSLKIISYPDNKMTFTFNERQR